MDILVCSWPLSVFFWHAECNQKLFYKGVELINIFCCHVRRFLFHPRVGQSECVRELEDPVPRVDSRERDTRSTPRSGPYIPSKKLSYRYPGNDHVFLQCVRHCVRQTVSGNVYFAARFVCPNVRLRLLRA